MAVLLLERGIVIVVVVQVVVVQVQVLVPQVSREGPREEGLPQGEDQCNALEVVVSILSLTCNLVIQDMCI